MQTATNAQGQKVQWNGSAWVAVGGAQPAPQAAPPPAPGPIVVGTPRPKEPPKPREAPSGYNWGPNGSLVVIPGGPADKPERANDTDGDGVKLQAKRAALTSLETQINRVQELYGKGFKDEALGVISSLGEYLPSDDAAALNSASAGLAEQGLAAFRVPGVGSQSDTELRQFVEANRPSSWDRDVAVEEKLRQLRGRVDATRQEMGLPPAQWDESRNMAEVEGGSSETLARSTNGFETIDDPNLKGVRGRYLAMLGAGATPGGIMSALEQMGVPMDARLRKSIAEQYQYRKKNPKVPLENYDTGVLDDKTVALSPVEGALNGAAQTDAGAYVMRAANSLTANNLDSIVGATGGNASRTRVALDDAGNSSPLASFAGDISGGVMAAMGAEGLLAAKGMGAGLGRSLLADSGYGAVAGAGAADDGSRIGGAALGAMAGFGGSAAGNALTRGMGNVVGGVKDASVKAVSEYAPVTIGQAVGRSGRLGAVVKGVEDRLAGAPILGDMVNARRTEGMAAMNAKAFEKALEPIGVTVGGAVGEEAVEKARGAVRMAFQDALAGTAAQLDEQFVGDARSALGRLKTLRRNDIGDEVIGRIEEATRGYIDPETGMVTGENMQALLESLREIRGSYANDPLRKPIADNVKAVERAVEGMFERQAPEVMPKYRAAKQAYRRVSILADSVNKGKNSEGMFTPAQLGMADRANASRFDGNMSAASGNSQFHDFQRDAQNVLPNRVPDSGTAGRVATLAAPGLIAGSGAGVGYVSGDTQGGAATGIGLATFLGLLYSKKGQSFLTAAMLKGGKRRAAIGDAIKKPAPLLGATGANAALLGSQSGGGQ